jgi:hypothetical protein
MLPIINETRNKNFILSKVYPPAIHFTTKYRKTTTHPKSIQWIKQEKQQKRKSI